jgi:hypothetical protein
MGPRQSAYAPTPRAPPDIFGKPSSSPFPSLLAEAAAAHTAHTIGTFLARLVFIGLEHYAWRRPPPARLHLHPYAVSKRHSHAAKRRATPSTSLSPSSSLHCRPPSHRRRPRPPLHTTARIGYTLRSTGPPHPRYSIAYAHRSRPACVLRHR